MTIPSVDLDDFLSSDSSRKSNFIQSLGKAFEEVGFVAVKNHGISADLISLLYNNVQSFFSLPLEKKRKFEVLGLAGQRGYTSFGKEHAKGSIAPDLKEFFQYGQVQQCSEVDFLPNVLVQQIDSFNTSFDTAYIAFENSGKFLLQAIALYLNLEQSYFDNYIDNGNSILRAIHYPPITQEPLSAIRAEQHEDINLITLLVGASADGLQILTKNNDWLSVTALPDQIVVNVGDMLQRLTNNKLKSTTHRVVNPSRDLWHTSRFSIPFFLHPKSSMSLRCLDNCVTTDQPILYTDISAGDYLDERLKEIGLKA